MVIPYWSFAGSRCFNMHLAIQPLSPLLLGASLLSPSHGNDPDSGESRYSDIQPNGVESFFFALSTYSAILCRHIRLDAAVVSSLIGWLCSHLSSAATSVANTGCFTHDTGHGTLFRCLDH